MLLPRPVRLAIDAVPVAVVQRVVEAVFRQAMRQHPGLFDRLGAEADKRFGFTPTDLDLSFVVHPAGRSIAVHRKASVPAADATATGPLLTLLALLEGRIDGDAVFFARGLGVAGDMEAMLALRNALDDSAIDLPSELGALAGPFSPLVAGAARHIRARALEGRDATWN